MSQKEMEHKCYLWAKANLEEMRIKLYDYGNYCVMSNNADTPVEQLWCSFRDYLLNTLDEFVPSKIVRNNQKQPWIGVRPICQHNFGNNRMLKEPRIMLE